MKGTTFAAYIREQTKTDSVTFTDAKLLTFANKVKEELAGDIVANVGENYFDMELTRDLEVGVRAYTYANDVLKHQKYLAAKLDGTNWTYLDEAFFSEFTTPMRENTYIKAKYAGKNAQFYTSGRELFILSDADIIAVTAGLKMVAEVYPEDLIAGDLAADTDLSIPSDNQNHRLPRQVHPFWATKVIIEWKSSQDKPIPLTQQEQRVMTDLIAVYEKLEVRNQVRSFQATVPMDDGQNY